MLREYSFCKGMWIRFSTTPYQSSQDMNLPHIHNFYTLHLEKTKHNLLSKNCTKCELQRAQWCLQLNALMSYREQIPWADFWSLSGDWFVNYFFIVSSIFGTMRQILFCTCKSFPRNTVLNTGQVKAYLHHLYPHLKVKKKKTNQNATSYITNHVLWYRSAEQREIQKWGWTAVKISYQKCSPIVSL